MIRTYDVNCSLFRCFESYAVQIEYYTYCLFGMKK